MNNTIGPDFCCRKGTAKESGPEPSLALVTSKSPVSLTPERAAFREGSTPSRRNIGAGVGGGHVRRCRPRTRKRPSSWRQLPSRAKHQTRRELIRSRRPPPQAGNTTSVSQVRKLRFSEVEHLPRVAQQTKVEPALPTALRRLRSLPVSGDRRHPHLGGLASRGVSRAGPRGVHRSNGGPPRGVGAGHCWTEGRPRGARAPWHCFLSTLRLAWASAGAGVGTPGASPHLPLGKAARNSRYYAESSC